MLWLFICGFSGCYRSLETFLNTSELCRFLAHHEVLLSAVNKSEPHTLSIPCICAVSSFLVMCEFYLIKVRRSNWELTRSSNENHFHSDPRRKPPRPWHKTFQPFSVFRQEGERGVFHVRQWNRLWELLEVGFVLLHLHHEVVQVDELGADGQAAERRLVQDFVEAVVVLDQLGQSTLQQEEEEEEEDRVPDITSLTFITFCQ